jgi:hypothetical protein
MTQPLFVFTAKFFSGIEWKHKVYTYIAHSAEQVEQIIDADICERQFRNKPFAKPEGQDSLVITRGEEVKLPYMIEGRTGL